MTKFGNIDGGDKFGNIYFTEDSGGLPGALHDSGRRQLIPSDTDSRIVRVDPNLPTVTGVTTDANGNLYVGDSKAGRVLYSEPIGHAETAGAVLLTPLPAADGVSVDWARGHHVCAQRPEHEQIFAR